MSASGRPPGPASASSAPPGGDPVRRDPRAIWLRSLGWRETNDGLWTGNVVATSSGRYRAMSLDEAFDVTLKRGVIDKTFQVEIADGYVRVALPWRLTAPQDRPQSQGGTEAVDTGAAAPRTWSAVARRQT
jgi:hypothetical protein